MTMTPAIRKFALTAHITFSVGWLGAVAGFLALAIAGPTSYDAQLMRGFYLAMGVTGWYVILPLCLASLVTGVVMSAGTKWGLFRHYWVTVKFFLTIISILILFGFMQTLGSIGVLATNTTMSIDELRNLSQSSVLHSGGGLLVLLVNTTLSVYKPWGRTRYGRREQHLKNEEMSSNTVTSNWERFGRYILLGIISLFGLFLALHLTLRSSH